MLCCDPVLFGGTGRRVNFFIKQNQIPVTPGVLVSETMIGEPARTLIKKSPGNAIQDGRSSLEKGQHANIIV